MPQNLVLVDGFAMMFRSFYAVRFTPQYEGKNINAVYGCATTLLQTIEQFSPHKIVVAFDAPEKTFRHELDPEYKAQRQAAPDEFVAQIELVKQLIEAFNIPLLISPGFEADDIIGTLATQAQDHHSYILSGDLDYLQLVSNRITLAKFNGKAPQLFDRTATIEKLGLPPEQVIDYKALCGDSSDNYKGLPGLGPKGASQLLKAFGSIKQIYQNLEQLTPKQQEKFTEHQDYVYHCQHLATIHCDVPLSISPQTLPEYQFDPQKLQNFLSRVGFNSLIKRVDTMSNKNTQKNNFEPNIRTEKSDSNKQISLF